jgi:aerobic C4-dicarboxylate transport protein
MATASTISAHRRPWYTVLYVQVLIAIAVGILIGHYFPNTGVALKPLGDGFISLIKMMIGPVIFCTVVHGIGSMRDLKKIGRIGIKTLFYFEAVSTLTPPVARAAIPKVAAAVAFSIDTPLSQHNMNLFGSVDGSHAAGRKDGWLALSACPRALDP